MNTLSSNFRSRLRLDPATLLPLKPSSHTLLLIHRRRRSSSSASSAVNGAVNGAFRVRSAARVLEAQLKEEWLGSLSFPFPDNGRSPAPDSNGGGGGESGAEWVVGIDPDASGALALLKPDGSAFCAQVFDTPYLQVLVGKRVRKRLDARSIIHLLRSFGAPPGTRAYIEQSNPFPKDGKQGWWSGGFTYGLWIGILVASGFSVVPVPSNLWKNYFGLSRSTSSKDDSRKAASVLFPDLASSLKRKKDHGRAEALLIAAYGKGLALVVESEPDAT
ncbi:uncharacterized protein LOC109719978 [Ananas comosus]|uniref:Uncharacterized protein LOC109719978 n=1 Tax=Ananas comosus TaxID=4615 RepID=A0A199UUZ4_ANACO|nr:uncharacterized protein LOC109719978 [Ananas comosus]OAY68461.1 hypothetical protein ACMD2_13167 [Ananas comosus]